MALDIEKCKECYYADEDGVCDKCCVDNAAFEPKRPNERVLEWISVKDRLPEEKGQYLVAYHPCYWDNVQENTICVGTDSFMGKTRWAKNKFQRVTHWQPFPEPPKGE